MERVVIFCIVLAVLLLVSWVILIATVKALGERLEERNAKLKSELTSIKKMVDKVDYNDFETRRMLKEIISKM